MCFYMVGAVRLELTTYRLKADYSSQLSYAPICLPLLSLSIWTLLILNFYQYKLLKPTSYIQLPLPHDRSP